MSGENITQAIKRLEALAANSDDPEVQSAVQELVGALQDASSIKGDAISVGNISGSTGVAIGRNIRMVVNQINLPADSVASLLDARSLLGGLDPDRYQLQMLLTDKSQGFVGREYVFEAIDQFLARHKNGFYTIEADPGMGKSAILAEYVRRTGYIAHFNVRAQGIVYAWQFLENVCRQIIVDFDLPYLTLPANATKDGAFLSMLLQEASRKLASGERLVIVIDALDEVDLTNHVRGANILYLPAILPDGVFFIMSRRQVWDLPFVVEAPQDLIDLMKYPTENRKDVELYIRRQAERPKIKAWIDKRSGLRVLKVNRFVRTLSDLSENNFMYLRHVLPAIEKGEYQELTIKNLPSGLEGYYESHWQYMGMTAKPLPRTKIRIVYILSVVRQPVSRQLITEFADDERMPVDSLMVQEVLDEWDQFLHKQATKVGTRYSIYHASFRDFLHRKEKVQAAGENMDDIHALIADNLWQELMGGE